MLAYLSLVLALAATAVVLGWVDLSVGHWPGISAGLGAVVAGIWELRKRRRGLDRPVAWIGAGLGLLAAGLGIAVYLGWGIAGG